MMRPIFRLEESATNYERNLRMAENGIQDIIKYFSKGAKKVEISEYKEFWQSLTEQEKAELKNADLSE